MRNKKDFIPLEEGFDPFEDNPDKYGGGFPREQIELFGGDGVPTKEAWLKSKDEDRIREDRERRLMKEHETEEVCIRVCFFVPQLPDAALFRKWLPKHRHILFGHFGYWITASLITAGAGTSLKTKCSQVEPLIMIVFLIITGIMVSLAKLFAPGGFRKNFGPTVVSFMMMFATGLALHQKPLICGFTSSSRRISIREQAMMWGIMVSLQVAIMIGTMLCYLFWHLKHKDEKREAELAGSPHLSEKSDQDHEPEYDSDEDSLQASPASVRWTARPRSDDELSNSV